MTRLPGREGNDTYSWRQAGENYQGRRAGLSGSRAHVQSRSRLCRQVSTRSAGWCPGQCLPSPLVRRTVTPVRQSGNTALMESESTVRQCGGGLDVVCCCTQLITSHSWYCPLRRRLCYCANLDCISSIITCKLNQLFDCVVIANELHSFVMMQCKWGADAACHLISQQAYKLRVMLTAQTIYSIFQDTCSICLLIDWRVSRLQHDAARPQSSRLAVNRNSWEPRPN